MPKSLPQDPKREHLQEQGNLNPHPERVSEPLFREKEFFDARDLLQVKYEMLRRVQKEGASVAAASAAFGFSRPAFYQIRERFEQAGLSGLLAKPRGPRAAHKLSGEVMRYLDEQLAQDPALKPPVLVRMLKERFELSVHPRSIERALARQEKKRRR